jgi:hypothetical protein
MFTEDMITKLTEGTEKMIWSAMDIIKYTYFDLVRRGDINMDMVALELLKNANDLSKPIEFGASALESFAKFVYTVNNFENFLAQENVKVSQLFN